LPTPPIGRKPVPPATTVDLKDLPALVGQYLTVSGKVYSSMLLVNIGAAYPNRPLAVALIDNVKEQAANINDEEITVTGTIIN
jgi:hypothetical protein